MSCFAIQGSDLPAQEAVFFIGFCVSFIPKCMFDSPRSVHVNPRMSVQEVCLLFRFKENVCQSRSIFVNPEFVEPGNVSAIPNSCLSFPQACLSLQAAFLISWSGFVNLWILFVWPWSVFFKSKSVFVNQTDVCQSNKCVHQSKECVQKSMFVNQKCVSQPKQCVCQSKQCLSIKTVFNCTALPGDKLFRDFVQLQWQATGLSTVQHHQVMSVQGHCLPWNTHITITTHTTTRTTSLFQIYSV